MVNREGWGVEECCKVKALVIGFYEDFVLVLICWSQISGYVVLCSYFMSYLWLVFAYLFLWVNLNDNEIDEDNQKVIHNHKEIYTDMVFKELSKIQKLSKTVLEDYDKGQ